MSKEKLEVRALPLSTAIAEQAHVVLDAGDALDTEQFVLFGMLKGKKYVPSQFKSINSAGGKAVVNLVLIPRFAMESGEDLVSEVMNPAYKHDHAVTREARKYTKNGEVIDVPRTTKTIKQWRNSQLVKPLGRLIGGYIDYLGELEQPLHESAAGKLVQIPTGMNHPTGPRNVEPAIAHANARQSINFIRGRKKVIDGLIANDKADTTDRVVLKWCDEGLHLLRGHIPKHNSKKSKSDSSK